MLVVDLTCDDYCNYNDDINECLNLLEPTFAWDEPHNVRNHHTRAVAA
jgi:hypothetical protein